MHHTALPVIFLQKGQAMKCIVVNTKARNGDVGEAIVNIETIEALIIDRKDDEAVVGFHHDSIMVSIEDGEKIKKMMLEG